MARARDNGVMDRSAVEHWVDRYERLWRSPGTDRLADLFLATATYLPSPWARPLEGLEEIAEFWEAEREGPDEGFSMASDVVRVSVDYADPAAGSWRDLWVLRFHPDGRCAAFEEWPFAPAQLDGH